MQASIQAIAGLGDSALMREIAALVARDRFVTAELLAHLAEADARRLYLAAGYPSMFDYCVRELGLSEDAAYKRIRAGRASRRVPALLAALAEGRIHLSGAVLLAPHLTPENADELLRAAERKTKSEIEVIVAERFPRPDLPSRLKALPGPQRLEWHDDPPSGIGDSVSQLAPGPVELSTGGSLWPDGDGGQGDAAGVGGADGGEAGGNGQRGDVVHGNGAHDCEARGGRAHDCGAQGGGAGGRQTHNGGARCDSAPRGRMTPLGPARFALQLTMSQETHDKFEHVKRLLSHQVPSGDLAGVLDRALDLAISALEKRKFAATARPRVKSSPAPCRTSCRQSAGGQSAGGSPAGRRTVPAQVRRAVWERDGGQCTFVGARGKRCPARAFLEFDHVNPVARGGKATVDGIRLRCRAHNQYEAERAFGEEFMRAKREAARRGSMRDVGVERRARRPGGLADDPDSRAPGLEELSPCPEKRTPSPDERLAPGPDLRTPSPERRRPSPESHDVVACLRALGCTAEESRRAALCSERVAGASIEERVRVALSGLGSKAVVRSHAGHPGPMG